MSYDEIADAEELREAAARRWPLAVSSRIDHRYPVSALYEFSRDAFVKGADWRQERTEAAIRDSPVRDIIAAVRGKDEPTLGALLDAVEVLWEQWSAVSAVMAEARDAIDNLTRVRALVADELDAAGSVQAVREIRQVLGEEA